MTKEECRIKVNSTRYTSDGANNRPLWEIAAQLAELNEKLEYIIVQWRINNA